MRFPQVAIGQRFTYQSRSYTKTGPLTASEEGSGNQRMIPRSAEVTPFEVADEAVRVTRHRYTSSEVESLLRRFKADLTARLREMATEDGSLQLDQVVELIKSDRRLDL